MMKLRRDQRHQTKRINTKMQCNHRCSMLSTDFSTNRAPNFFQLRLFNLITLGNASAENKGLECTQSLTITSKVVFQTMFFFISSLGKQQIKQKKKRKKKYILI